MELLDKLKPLTGYKSLCWKCFRREAEKRDVRGIKPDISAIQQTKGNESSRFINNHTRVHLFLPKFYALVSTVGRLRAPPPPSWFLDLPVPPSLTLRYRGALASTIRCSSQHTKSHLFLWYFFSTAQMQYRSVLVTKRCFVNLDILPESCWMDPLYLTCARLCQVG